MLDLKRAPFDPAMAGLRAPSVPRKETMRQYELTYLISDLVPESDLNKVTGKVGGYIRDLGGDLIKEEIWGRRKLAYPIKKQEFATYVTTIFNLPSEKAKEFERNIVLTGKIIRQLMLVVEYGKEVLTLSKEDVVETEEIEEVIGGERSFEAVEGMTDESRDLMSLRDENETAPTLQSESRHEIVGKESKDLMAVRGESEKSDNEEKPAEEMTKKIEIETEQKESKAEAEEKEPLEDDSKKASAPESIVKAKKVPAAESSKENKEDKKAKAVKKPTAKKPAKENEADRLSKLDEELDNILGKDL